MVSLLSSAVSHMDSIADSKLTSSKELQNIAASLFSVVLSNNPLLYRKKKTISSSQQQQHRHRPN